VLISPDGAELLCDPDRTNADWATIISAQALPLAATLWELEVLHAAGVVLEGGALLIAGASGAGKSSLAAALIRRGATLLSDDSVALQLDNGKLSAEDRAALGRPAVTIEGKLRYVGGGGVDAVPLRCLLLLERSPREPALERLQAPDPFALLASTFNLSVRTPARLLRQLDVVSAIAADRLVYRLRVQPGVDAAALAQIVLSRLARPGRAEELASPAAQAR
jgi:serine kinase of HPr protein (carbohydrate metabolism regulator)